MLTIVEAIKARAKDIEIDLLAVYNTRPLTILLSLPLRDLLVKNSQPPTISSRISPIIDSSNSAHSLNQSPPKGLTLPRVPSKMSLREEEGEIDEGDLPVEDDLDMDL
ncbi:hypothetical protein HAX54_001443 [Datura stramonium]|uniref:Uncharacterized protein n=1 Tax=Datura stramonium TaxID=4076 RepID=A0ABS8WQQ8_DATST|nr:hypothetical protein [Datura stramonium]